MSVPTRAVERHPAIYGWNADGKTATEIASDARQTRYRLEADLRELRQRIKRAKWPAAALAGLTLLTLLIRKIRR